jgi:hypothetical protein
MIGAWLLGDKYIGYVGLVVTYLKQFWMTLFADASAINIFHSQTLSSLSHLRNTEAYMHDEGRIVEW